MQISVRGKKMAKEGQSLKKKKGKSLRLIVKPKSYYFADNFAVCIETLGA